MFGTRSAVEGGRFVVPLLDGHPQSRAPLITRKSFERLHQGAPDAPSTIGSVDAQLVKEHLDLLVGMRDLDSRYETSGHAIHLSQQQVVAVPAQESLGPFLTGCGVKQMTGIRTRCRSVGPSRRMFTAEGYAPSIRTLDAQGSLVQKLGVALEPVGGVDRNDPIAFAADNEAVTLDPAAQLEH